MRYRWPGVLVLGLALSVSSLALAQDQKKPATKKTEAKGPKGLSPFMESIVKGNAAYIARDYEGAVAAYQEAVRKVPNRAFGHFMLGQAFLAEKKLNEADGAWQAALRFSEKEPALRAKVLFVIADLREQQGRWDDALNSWKAYADFLAANKKVRGFPNTPIARRKAIERRKELEEQYSKVRERIAQRERELAEKAGK